MEESEEFNEWEEVQYHWPQTRPNTPTKGPDEKLVTGDNSIFPPINHEDLPIAPQNSSSSPAPADSGDGDRVDTVSASGDASWRLRLRLGALSSRIYDGIGFIIRKYGMFGRTSWSFRSLTGLLTAVLMSAVYAGARRWRRRVRQESKSHLTLLIRERDEKINHLLLQISQMNEILSTRHRVPVFRVG